MCALLDYVTVFEDTTGRTLDLASLASTAELLASVTVPTGTYTQARITFGDHITLVSNSGTSTSVAVDTGNFVYVCGYTDVPTSFPTPNGFRTSLVGGSDGFVMKFATNGQSLNYGTYLGGTYANLFPGKLRAMALDGTLDLVANATGQPGQEHKPVDVRADVATAQQQYMKVT